MVVNWAMTSSMGALGASTAIGWAVVAARSG
jgi:hypothetical protein